MPSLPEVGVALVAKNKALFDAAMQSVNKALDTVGGKAEATAKKFNGGISAAFDKTGLSVEGLRQKFLDMTAQSGRLGQAAADLIPMLESVSSTAVLVAAGIAAIAVAVVTLGQRGAAFSELTDSFDRLTASVGLVSTTLLGKLQKATEGTVSNLDLVRATNDALIGTTGELGKQLGQALPTFMRAARVEADATGKSFGEIFNAFIESARKGQTRGLEQAGIILNVKEAEEQYATSIGKTVAQLTEEDKRLAILQGTLAAANSAIALSGDAQESNADKIDRMNATITNTLDTLALAVQPAFGMILDTVNTALGMIEQVVTAIGPIITPVLNVIVGALMLVANTVLALIQPFIDLASAIDPYLALALQVVASAFQGLVAIISTTVGGVLNWLAGVFQSLFGFPIAEMIPRMFHGAAFVFGALAAGIMQAANTLIFPAVIQIATFIADFLTGSSPAKRGPLHYIDTGAGKLMESWLQGFTGVSLDPVREVAAQVSAALGDIGAMTLPQVEARLAKLDRALRPFEQRLAIVKANFDAIKDVADAAMNAVDRQLDGAVERLLKGEAGSAELVRSLDAQRGAIENAVSAQQDLIDNAQIQLALVKAQQAQERALLNVRKQQLGPAQQAAALAGKKATSSAGGGAAGPKPKEPTGAGAPPEAAPSGGGGFTPPSTSSADMLSGQQAVNDALANLQGGFQEGVTAFGDVSGQFSANQGALQTQLNRIGSADVGATLSKKFSGIGKGIQTALDEAGANINTFVTTTVPAFFAALPGYVQPKLDEFGATINTFVTTTVPDFFRNLPTNIQNALPALTGILDTSIVQPLTNTFNTLTSTLLADAGTDGSIAQLFAHIPVQVADALITLGNALNMNLFNPVQNILTRLLTTLFADSATEGSFAFAFAQLILQLPTALAALGDTLVAVLVTPISEKIAAIGAALAFFFSDPTNPAGVKGLLDAAVAFFAELPQRIFDALAALGSFLTRALLTPFVTVINNVIAAFETLIKNALLGVATIAANIAQAMSGIPELSGIAMNTVNFGISAANTAASFHINRLAVPGAATGGVFGPGLLRVGERGQEMISAASRVSVFPHSVVRALDSIASVMAQPAPYVGGGMVTNNTSSSVDNSINANFYGVKGSSDVMRRLAVAKAYR
jgi:hypothetical protein